MITCAACGVQVASAKFCGSCGALLTGERASVWESLAEQRPVSVLFCDLIGSTELSESLGAEEYSYLLSSYQEGATTAVHAFEGHVAQYLGDGLLIYFGYPVAHEDDPRRAILASLAILDAVARLNESGKYPAIAVRIGVHSGMVITGQRGPSAKRDDLALGLAPNVAARLQSVAKPGSIVVSDAMRSQTDGFFRFEALGHHSIKGVSEPLALFSVTGVTTYSRNRAFAARGLTPFVGRAGLVAELTRLWSHTCNGSSAVVLIRGDGGLGKTRLTRLVSERARASGGTLTDCECSPLHANTTLFPVIDFLESRVLRLPPEAPATQRLDRMEALLDARGLDRARCVPLLASLLNTPCDPRYTLPNMGPELQREETLSLMQTLVTTSRKPHLLVFEDMQWSDATTIELVQRLIRARPLASTMIVMNCRPEFKPAWLDDGATYTIDLEGLDPDELTQLIEHVARSRSLPSGVIQRIAETAAGNPLFAEELTKTVVESAPTEALAEAEHHVPQSLHASLMARLERLGSASKEVARRAAVLGPRFPHGLLAAIAEMKEEQLRAGLDKLIDAGLLFASGEMPHRTYQFNHALVRVAAYESLLRRVRESLHARVVSVLESDFPEVASTQPEVLARHCQLAGMVEASIDYWLKAGQSSFARSANIEAAAHLRAGQALLGSLPDTAPRVQRELMLLRVLGPALIATTGFASREVGEVYERARALCDQVPDSPDTFLALAGSWVFHLVKGDLATSRRYAEEMLALGRQTNDDNLLIEARYSLGNSLYWLGDLDAARVELEAAAALYAPERHQSHVLLYGQDPGVTSRCYLTFTYWMLGRSEAAWSSLAAAVDLAEQLDHPFTTAWPMAFLVLMRSHRREPEEARTAAQRLIDFAMEQHQVYWLAAALIVRGWAMARLGQVDEGVGGMRYGIDAYAGSGAGVSLPHFIGLLAEVLLANGNLDGAEAELDRAETIAEANGERVALIDLRRLRGDLVAARGDAASAEAHYRDAVAIALETGAVSPGLRAANSLHRAMLDHGDAESSPLRDLASRFPSETSTPDLLEARALLGGTHTSPVQERGVTPAPRQRLSRG